MSAKFYHRETMCHSEGINHTVQQKLYGLKIVSLVKMQFLHNQKKLFTKIPGFTPERFFNIPWLFHLNIFTASEIKVFIIFYSIFQNYTEKWTVTFNVQRSTFEMSISASILAQSFLWSSEWPCWFSPVAAGPILTANFLRSVSIFLTWDE